MPTELVNGFGNISQVKEGDTVIESSTYFDTLLKEKTLANGYEVCYNYDDKGRVVSATENDSESPAVTVAYNGDNTTVTHANGVTYTSEKVNSDSVTSRFTATNNGKTLKIEGVPLIDAGRNSETKYYRDGSYYFTETVTKDENGNIYKIEFSGNGARRQLYYYDEIYRKKSKIVTVGNSDTSPFIFGYEYKTYKDAKTNETLQTNLVEKETLRIGSSGTQTDRSYEYYKDGKLMFVRKSGELAAGYIYDDYGRLKTEVNYERGKEYSYTYDSNGNILSKKTYKLLNGETFEKEDLYEYSAGDRKDLLIGYNGATITYDKYGNPLTYKGKTFEWKGKNLVEADGLLMEYDYNGLRTKKGDKKYFWYGNRLLAETYKKNNVENTIFYRYDESGVCGMTIGAADYYFRKNIFGDILAVYNSSKTVLATYTYDAFGNASVTYANVQNNLARLNPFRYRGYYWDEDLELYYLQSRYYDPEIGRFISPDSGENINPSEIFGLNLYAYCYNNPIGIVYGRGGVVGNVRNVVGSASYFVNPNGLSVEFAPFNWIATGADFSASLVGVLSVIRWVGNNPEFYHFLNSAYGVSQYDVLINLKSPLTKLATAISYGLVAYDTVMDIIGHINAGDSWQTTVASGVTTAGIGVFNIWASAKIGAKVGGLAGGPAGALIGVAVGTIAGIVINGIFYIEINGKSIAGYIEDGLRWLLEWLI